MSKVILDAGITQLVLKQFLVQTSGDLADNLHHTLMIEVAGEAIKQVAAMGLDDKSAVPLAVNRKMSLILDEGKLSSVAGNKIIARIQMKSMMKYTTTLVTLLMDILNSSGALGVVYNYHNVTLSSYDVGTGTLVLETL